jgi:dsRNA-specific ribonuclease
VNAKGLLLEYRGTVDSSSVGGSDHSPVFKAIARIAWEKDDQVVEAIGEATRGTKKSAEQIAAKMCLLDFYRNCN